MQRKQSRQFAYKLRHKSLTIEMHHFKFFVFDQNVEKSLKCIFTKIEVSTSSRFQDTAFQN